LEREARDLEALRDGRSVKEGLKGVGRRKWVAIYCIGGSIYSRGKLRCFIMDESCRHDLIPLCRQSLARLNNSRQPLLIQCNELPKISTVSVMPPEVCLLFIPVSRPTSSHRLLSCPCILSSLVAPWALISNSLIFFSSPSLFATNPPRCSSSCAIFSVGVAS